MRALTACLITLILVTTSFTKLAAKPTTDKASQAVDQAWQLYQGGDCQRAQTILNDALRVAPEWTPIYFNLGVSAEHCGDPLLAARYYRQYASSHPNDASWVASRASMLEQQVSLGVAQPGSPAAAQNQDAARPRRGFPWWGWVLIGVGAVVVLGVAVTVASGDSETGFNDSY